MNRPRHLLSEWPRLRARLARKRRALLTDFDGTLAPIQRDPAAPQLSRGVRQTLRLIARRDALGIITGRTLRDIRQRVRLRDIWYAGSHGYEICDPKGRSRLCLSERERKLIRSVTRAVRRQLKGVVGLVIESKPAMVAVHYRSAAPKARERARQVVAQVAARYPGAALMSGKKVWDIAPKRDPGAGGKWAAVDHILRRVRRQGARRAWVAAYIGDDTTDEQVFRHLHGITVAVGKARHTAARYYLRSPSQVAQFLKLWEEL